MIWVEVFWGEAVLLHHFGNFGNLQADLKNPPGFGHPKWWRKGSGNRKCPGPLQELYGIIVRLAAPPVIQVVTLSQIWLVTFTTLSKKSCHDRRICQVQIVQMLYTCCFFWKKGPSFCCSKSQVFGFLINQKVTIFTRGFHPEVLVSTQLSDSNHLNLCLTPPTPPTPQRNKAIKTSWWLVMNVLHKILSWEVI